MYLVFWQAFILTVLLETPILIWFYKKRKWWKIALLSLVLNAFTLSFVWFMFFPALSDYAQFFVSAEFYAFAAEALILAELFKKEGWRNAVVASAFANAVSAGVGLLLAFAL